MHFFLLILQLKQTFYFIFQPSDIAFLEYILSFIVFKLSWTPAIFWSIISLSVASRYSSLRAVKITASFFFNLTDLLQSSWAWLHNCGLYHFNFLFFIIIYASTVTNLCVCDCFLLRWRESLFFHFRTKICILRFIFYSSRFYALTILSLCQPSIARFSFSSNRCFSFQVSFILGLVILRVEHLRPGVLLPFCWLIQQLLFSCIFRPIFALRFPPSFFHFHGLVYRGSFAPLKPPSFSAFITVIASHIPYTFSEHTIRFQLISSFPFTVKSSMPLTVLHQSRCHFLTDDSFSRDSRSIFS